MRRLSGMDAAFLYLETPTAHMNIHSIMIIDPQTMPGGYSFAKIKEFVGARLPRLREFRQSLAPVPLNLHHPVWFDDPAFDIDYHVRRTAVPAPGGPEELADLTSDIASRPLDRSRPLWELWVVEGLDQGRVGVVAKIHHATIDGVSGSNMATQILDLSPEPSEPAAVGPWEPEHRPSDLELLGYALRSRLSEPRPLAWARTLPRVAQGVTNIVRARRDPSRAAGGTPLTAPRAPWNAPLTPHRKVAFTSVPLAEVKAIKTAFGCTVNDVVLASAAGALRLYLERLGSLPGKPLLATCPVSVRGEETESIESANKVSAMFVPLATDVADPVERLRTIHESTKGAKEEHNALGARTIMSLGELASPNIFGLAARMYSGLRLASRHPAPVNVIVSNVPGPPFPLYLAGAKLVSLLPLGPPMEGIGLNLTVFSYLDHIDWGFLACRELVPGLWDLAGAVGGAHAELLKAAGEVGGAGGDSGAPAPKAPRQKATPTTP